MTPETLQLLRVAQKNRPKRIKLNLFKRSRLAFATAELASHKRERGCATLHQTGGEGKVADDGASQKKKDRGYMSRRIGWKKQHRIILIATLAGIDLTALGKNCGGNGICMYDDAPSGLYMSVCAFLYLRLCLCVARACALKIIESEISRRLELIWLLWGSGARQPAFGR